MRTENDELVIYRPHTTQTEAGNGASNLRLFKESNYSLPEASSPGIEQHSKKLRVLPNVSGLSTVFMPGASAGFVLKTSSTVPHVIRLRGEYAQCLSSFDSSEIRCTQGFVYVDAEVFPLVDVLIGIFELNGFSRVLFGYASFPKTYGWTIRGQCKGFL